MAEYGIALVGCRHFTVTGNVVRNTVGGPGFCVDNCTAGTINANNVSESAQDGVVVSGSRQLAILANIVDTFGKSPASGAPWRGLRLASDCAECQETANIVCGQV